MRWVRSDDPSHESGPDRFWTIAVLGLVGVSASVLIALALRDHEQRLLESQVDHRGHDRARAIELEMRSMVTQVQSIADLFRIAESVDREQFRTIAGSILEHHPEIQGLGFNAVVRHSARQAHEARVRLEGHPGYSITEKAADGSLVPAAQRPEYVPVTFVEPLAGNQVALGYDTASEPLRREALDRARDSGEAALTEPITLVQESQHELGALILLPLFDGDTPRTVSERRARVNGFAVGILRVGDLVNHALAGLTPAGISLRVSDDTAPAAPHLLHVHRSRTVPSNAVADVSHRPMYSRSYGFDIAGRHWRVEATPTSALVTSYITWAPAGTLLTGLLITLAVIAYFLRQAGANARLRSALRARDRAEELRAGFGRVLDESHDEVYVFAAGSLRFLHVNRGARTNLGYTMEELRTMTPVDLKPRLTLESFSALLQPLRDGGRTKLEFTTEHRRKDGSRYDVEVHLQMTSFGGGPAFVAVILDITDRRRLEVRQQQSQKLEALGTLAGGTAHDVNNLLTAIMGYTELSLAEVPAHGNARLYLGEVVKASERARDVVRQILTFGRRNPIEKLPIDLGEVVGEALRLMLASLPATVAVHEDLADACWIQADSSQIHQVLVNLCTNAAHALPDRGGVIEVSVEAVELDAAEAARHGDLNSGDYARVRVRDNGRGIPPEVRDRIFDPFFTTKQQGEGTGMGLAVVHGIVKSHGGTIHVTSEVDRGTLIEVYFPRVDAHAVAVPDDVAVATARGERIIVVDDEPAIVTLLTKMLAGSGYAVEAHPTGPSALEALRERADHYDLVITDYSMPTMTGTTLAREIGRLSPDLPVILVSGYGDLLDQEEVRSSGVRELLTKPLRRHELTATVRRALDDASSARP